MAWLTQADTNEALVDKMTEFGLFKSPELQMAFRNTDRGQFIGLRTREAYSDHPFKNNHVHLSAPHMYVSILEALDLRAGQSFLNIGSGSGYLSCLASCLLGEFGLSHGIEIKESLVYHSRNACKTWFADILKRRKDGETDLPAVSEEGVSFAHGSCFDIDVKAACSTCRYDRIYIGAGCPVRHLEFFLSLLADEGVLVVPVNECNQLIRIHRVLGEVYTTKRLSSVHYAPLIDVPKRRLRSRSGSFRLSIATGGDSTDSSSEEGSVMDEEEEEQVLGLESDTGPMNEGMETAAESGDDMGVASDTEQEEDSDDDSSTSASQNNAAMVVSTPAPKTPVRLPPVLWAPTGSRHKQFPPSFRTAVRYILSMTRFAMCKSPADCVAAKHQAQSRSQSSSSSLSSSSSKEGVTAAPCSLDMHLWERILGFASRDWFVPVLSEQAQLYQEISVERKMRQSAEKSAHNLDKQLRKAERERDLYKAMVTRLRTSALDQRASPLSNSAQDVVDNAQALLGTLTNLIGADDNDTSSGEEEEEEEEDEEEEDDDELEVEEVGGEEEEEEEDEEEEAEIDTSSASEGEEGSEIASASPIEADTTQETEDTERDSGDASASFSSLLDREALTEGNPAMLRKAKALLLSRMHPPPFASTTAAPKKARRYSMDTDHEGDSSRSNSLISEDAVSWIDWSDIPSVTAPSKEKALPLPQPLAVPLSASGDDEADSLEYLSADDEEAFHRKHQQRLDRSTLPDTDEM